jgi:hypothetical protein
MDRIIKNYEEPLEGPISLKQTIKHLKHKRNVKKLNKIGKKLDMINGSEHNHEPAPQQQQQMPIGNIPPADEKIYHFAIVIEDLLIDVMHVYAPFADVLRNGPKFVELKEDEQPLQGSVYKDGKFIPFQEVLKDASPTVRGGG